MMRRAKQTLTEVSFIDVIRKELHSIFTDSGALLIVVFAMLIYTLIYSSAYGSEVVERVSIAIVDEDNSPLSRSLVDGLRAGPNTQVRCEINSMDVAQEMFYNHDVYGIVYIPDGFERNVLGGLQGDISLILDSGHLLLYRQVLEQAVADILEIGASIEVNRLIVQGNNNIESIVEPVIFDNHILYNPSLGYGSFVMPTILIVIIQQTMLIGIAMVRLRRKSTIISGSSITLLSAAKYVTAKMIVYIALYAINLTIILSAIWPLFGFPYAGSAIDIAALLFIYMVAVAALGITISHLFARREAPLVMLLWCSVPILLLAGVSYPREAFPEWLYILGRIIPSSSAVDAFVAIGSMGASLGDRLHDIILLLILAIFYLGLAIIMEYGGYKVKKIIKHNE